MQIRFWSSASPTWSSTYDALGHVATSTDPFGRVTTTVSDMFGQVLSTTQPDPDGSGPLVGSGMQYKYDAFGNVLMVIDQGNPASVSHGG